MAYTTRREFLGGLALASIPGILPAISPNTSGANSSAARLGRRDFGHVRERILKEIAAGSATGAAVAVADKGRIVREEGFGWANREAAVKTTPRTPFNLASLTKPFTATTLMTLVAEGKLPLDDPANNHLAKSRIVGANGNADATTVRQLGAHVSGLPTMFAMYYRNESNLAPNASAHDLARFAMFNMKDRDRAPILSDRWIDELHKPVFVGPSGAATTFGWFTQQLKSGQQVIFKGGGQPGVATVLYMMPSENLACLVLTNRSDGGALCQSVCNEILSYLPEWRQPDEASGPPPSPLVITPGLGGRWHGTLTNDGAKIQVRLNIESSDSAMLQLGEEPSGKITEMHLEGAGFTGTSMGLVESPDARRNAADTLKLKLIPHEGMLVGRILATDSKTVMLPYILSLNRALT